MSDNHDGTDPDASGGTADGDDQVVLIERLMADDAAVVIHELSAAGISAHLLALPEDRETGPFDVLIAEEDADAASDIVEQIELAEEEPDNWFSERPQWQQAMFVLLGILIVLIPVFFAFVAIIRA